MSTKSRRDILKSC